MVLESEGGRRRWALPFACGLAIGLLYQIMLELVRFQFPPDWVWLGWVRIDNPVYFANAREIFEGGNGFAYPNPFSLEKDPTPIYFNLQLMLLGWLWRLGIPIPWLETGARLVGAAFMFGFAYRFLALYIPGGRTRHAAAALVCLGGNFTVVPALASALFAGTGRPLFSEFLWAHRFLESNWGRWCLSLSSNLAYVTELFYHALVFAAAGLALTGRRWWAIGVLALEWWAHPFTGVNLGVVLTGWFGVEGLLAWRRGESWRPWLQLFAAALAVDALFLSYYQLILPQFADHKGIMGVWQGEEIAAKSRMQVDLIPYPYGPLWIGVLWWFSRAGREALRTDPRHRFLLVFAAAIMILSMHDRLPFVHSAIQPLHFLRGYLYVILAIASVCLVRTTLIPWGSPVPRIAKYGLAAVMLTAAADQAVSYVRFSFLDVGMGYNGLISVGPGRKTETIMAVPSAQWAAIETFDRLPGTHRVLTVEQSPSDELGYFLSVYTPHQGYIGHFGNTPNIQERIQSYLRWLKNPDVGLLDRDGITAISVDMSFVEYHPALKNRKWIESLDRSLGPGWTRVPTAPPYEIRVRRSSP